MDQHFDAERLAAFADGSLTAAERAAAEAHAADCSQCLQLLAAMARTHEEQPRPSHGMWRLPLFVRWAAPLAAAATGVALWLNVAGAPQQLLQESSEQAKAKVAAAAADEVKPPVDRPTPAPDTANVRKRDEQLRQSAVAKEKSILAPALEEKREGFDRLDKQVETGKSAAQFSARREAAKRAPDPEPRPVSPALTQTAEAPAAATPAPPPAAEPSSTSAAAKPAAPARTVVPETVSQEQVAVGNVADVKDVRQRLASALAIEAVAADRRYRWRVNGAVVERSTDGGATWVSVQGIPGAQVMAIAAPSPTVAWFVGRAGIVFVFSESTLVRVTFPESIDLPIVRAVSAREANVTTVDGRTFRTSDGGQTWSLQEIPPSSF